MVTATESTDKTALFAAMNAGSSSATKKSAAEETQDRFLKLLVTQMKNQDPLNPMDNAQVTSQMAQLSTVTGIDKLNITLKALSDSMTGNQSVQAASMIGHGVMVPGEGIDLIQGSGFGGVDLAQSVDKLDITINDKSGALIRNIQLGSQPAGVLNWQWDGRDNSGVDMADGNYTFTINAAQGSEKVDATKLQFGMVNSVTMDKQGVALSVGQLDGITLEQIRQIL